MLRFDRDGSGTAFDAVVIATLQFGRQMDIDDIRIV